MNDEHKMSDLSQNNFNMWLWWMNEWWDFYSGAGQRERWGREIWRAGGFLGSSPKSYPSDQWGVWENIGENRVLRLPLNPPGDNSFSMNAPWKTVVSLCFWRDLGWGWQWRTEDLVWNGERESSIVAFASNYPGEPGYMHACVCVFVFIFIYL